MTRHDTQTDLRLCQPSRDEAKRLWQRMCERSLLARPDPTGSANHILICEGARASLGAGRVASSIITAALALGFLYPRADGLLAPQPRPEPAVGLERDPADRASAPPQVNDRESPLLWLYRRRGANGQSLLGESEFLAGERFRQDATAASLMPAVTMNWDRVERASGAGAPRDPAMASERTVQARQRVRTVFRLLGAETGNFLLDVCAFLQPLHEAERARGWPARSGKLVLKLALARLAAHYGIATEATGSDSHKIAAWMDADARATPDQWLAGCAERSS